MHDNIAKKRNDKDEKLTKQVQKCCRQGTPFADQVATFLRALTLSLYLQLVFFPFLFNHSVWWSNFYLACANFLPVGGQDSAITLLVALHHGASGIWISASVKGFEEAGHFVTTFVFVIIVVGYLVPVLGTGS
jgi:hypothetical protein